MRYSKYLPARVKNTSTVFPLELSQESADFEQFNLQVRPEYNALLTSPIISLIKTYGALGDLDAQGPIVATR